jgi:hypothetical protein
MVVVIHGWFWDHRVFTPIFDCLDAASYTFAFIDIRGYGNSRQVPGGYTIGEVAADAIALTEELGARVSRRRPFHGRQGGAESRDGRAHARPISRRRHPGTGFGVAVR